MSPSLLAVSHVVQSGLFTLTEAALYMGPTADTPFDNATWNWISPIPYNLQKNPRAKKKGETLVIENHNFEQKESMYIEYRQVYNVKQQTKRFTAMLY